MRFLPLSVYSGDRPTNRKSILMMKPIIPTATTPSSETRIMIQASFLLGRDVTFTSLLVALRNSFPINGYHPLGYESTPVMLNEAFYETAPTNKQLLGERRAGLSILSR